MQTKRRPKFLDVGVLSAALPVPGIVSILHRISGVVLFVMLPILLALLAGSLSSGEVFAQYKAWADNVLVKLILIGVLWAFCHHLFAGIRFLLLDAHIGLELQSARQSARVVLFAGVIVAVILGVALW